MPPNIDKNDWKLGIEAAIINESSMKPERTAQRFQLKSDEGAGKDWEKTLLIKTILIKA